MKTSKAEIGGPAAGITSPLSATELLSQVRDAINATDANGILHTWNAAAERIFGYAAHEVLGQHVDMLLFPEDRISLQSLVFEPLAHADSRELVVRNRRKDGTEIFVAVRLSVIRDSSGNIIHIVACCNDVTEYKRNRELLEQEAARRAAVHAALQESENRLKHLLTNGPAVLYTCRPDGDFGATFVSENVKSLFGYEPEDFINEPLFWANHIHPEDRERVWSELLEKISTGRVFLEYRFLHADGTYRWVRDTAAMITDANGKRVEMIGHMIDVTQEKAAEERRAEHERLKYFAEALLAAQEAVQKRVSRELHDDLNQQLAVCILELGTLEREIPAAASATKKKIKALKSEIARISDDVRNIALQLHSSGLDHFGLRVALKQECAWVSQRSGIKVRFRTRGVPEKLPEKLSLCLYRVAQESLRNVVRHSKASAAEVVLAADSDRIQLTISDCGIGFNPDHVRKGTTLGIMSMNERLRQVNGVLKLYSEPGSGTRIEASVPLKREVAT